MAIRFKRFRESNCELATFVLSDTFVYASGLKMSLVTRTRMTLSAGGSHDGRCSHPIFGRILGMGDLRTRHIVRHDFRQISGSLFSVSIVLHVVNRRSRVSRIRAIVLRRVSGISRSLSGTATRLGGLVRSGNVSVVPNCAGPGRCAVRVGSPRITRFTRLVHGLSALVKVISAL